MPKMPADGSRPLRMPTYGKLCEVYITLGRIEDIEPFMHAELFAHHSLVRLTRALRAAVLRRAVSSHLSPVWPATQQPSALRVEHWSYASHRSRRPRPCLLTKT